MTSLAEAFDPEFSGPPHVCVEMSGNHQGRLEAALDFVDAAHAAGADSVKVQVYRPDTITMDSDGEDFRVKTDENDWASYGTLYRLYEKAHTPWTWIEAIFERAGALGLPVFASPFDPSAIDFLESLGCPAYKIASPEIGDVGLIEHAAKTGKPVIMSTGLADAADLDLASAVCREAGVPFAILKCVSAYPTPVEDVNLASIPWLAQRYGCPAGFSDHTLGPEAGYAAAALGARIIEKHFKLPGDETSVDAAFSMSLDALAAFKTGLARVHAAVGAPTLEIPEISRASLAGRRSLYVVKPVAAGEPFTVDNVRSIRPAFGLAPKHLPDVLGRRAARDVAAGERMSWDLLAEPD